ncbi:Peptidyl-tRNA hydrolase [Candidatus Providencia siddallii]|uniref:Peptidyl-tRNA hydrolase n=1 Tax=Candidatus Providencia siddallii TaxID=1715285 RepID=A0A0M6W708_9GAMM|nr:Peptidyl-tRNA hydrolase [Candidatus Providencia siddallii]
MNKIKLIVGLANPGVKYAKTRHNIGSLYIRLLANYYNKKLKQESKFFGFTTFININNINIYLLIPTTFVNLSGKSVLAMMNYYNINADEILIVHDDLDLPTGIAKIKFGGSNAGHNGLKNIQSNLNNNSNYYRLRIGIGHPGDKNKVINYVLEKPTIFEQKLINDVIKKVISCTDILFFYDKYKELNYSHIFKATNYE